MESAKENTGATQQQENNLGQSPAPETDEVQPTKSHSAGPRKLARQRSTLADTQRDPPMKAVFVMGETKPLIVSEILPPKPGPGEVLIKVEAAPINPSDINFIRGNYIHLTPPFQIGLEGSGTVLSSGGGQSAGKLVGKRVSFCALPARPGSWAQYVVTLAQNCFVMEDDIDWDHGACAIINPFTAVAFVETIKKEKHRAIVQTTAASQLGKMVIKLLKKEGVKVISIIKNKEQLEALEGVGSDVIIDTSNKGFEEELRAKAADLHATCLFESVCGETTHKLLRNMPRDTICYIHGHLEKDLLTPIDFADLLINNKTVKAFSFQNWFQSQGFFSKFRAVGKAHRMLSNELKTEIAKVFEMKDVNDAIKFYLEHPTQGKVIIKPNVVHEETSIEKEKAHE